jgi:hypothetical protein
VPLRGMSGKAAAQHERALKLAAALFPLLDHTAGRSYSPLV